MEQTVRTPSASEQRILSGLWSLTDPGKTPATSRAAVAAVVDYCEGRASEWPVQRQRDAYGELCDEVCRLITSDPALDPIRALCRPDAPRMDARMHRWLEDAVEASKRAREYALVIAPPEGQFIDGWGFDECDFWSARAGSLDGFCDLVQECLIYCENQMPATSTLDDAETPAEPQKGGKFHRPAADIMKYITGALAAKIEALLAAQSITDPAGIAAVYLAAARCEDGRSLEGSLVYSFVRRFTPDAEAAAVSKAVNRQKKAVANDASRQYKVAQRIDAYLELLQEH